MGYAIGFTIRVQIIIQFICNPISNGRVGKEEWLKQGCPTNPISDLITKIIVIAIIIRWWEFFTSKLFVRRLPKNSKFEE